MTYTVEAGTAMAKHVNALIDAKLTVPADTTTSDQKLDQIIGLIQSGNTGNPSTTHTAFIPNTKTTQRIIKINQRKPRQGMNQETGRLMTGIDHLKQSIRDIIRTTLRKVKNLLIGTRVMRRTYGSRVFDRVDLPQNRLTHIHYIADVADALDKWEPRFNLKQVKVQASKNDQDNGKLFFTLTGQYLEEEIELGVAV